jgi:hypothetical protein
LVELGSKMGVAGAAEGLPLLGPAKELVVRDGITGVDGDLTVASRDESCAGEVAIADSPGGIA